MLQRQPVPLIGAKRAGFRYNRRDIQLDEPFEAVNPTDADVLVRAKLARRPLPPDPTARARAPTAGPGDDRSRIAGRDVGIPAPEVAVIIPRNVASSEAPPELRADPTELEPPPAPARKKRVRNRRKAATVGDPPAAP